MIDVKGLLSKMFNFDSMITPLIIKFIYGLFVIIAVIAGIGTMTDGDTFLGFVIIIGSPFLLRISCESLIVIFKINENLAKLVKNSSNYREEI